MKRQLLTLIALALPLAAQDAPKPAPAPTVQKVILLKYADARAMQSLLNIFDASITSNTGLHALAVKATPGSMQAIEETIARLDTPAIAEKDIDLTVHLVVGSDGEAAAAGALPKELDSVVAQLKNTFPFKTYRLLDILTMRVRSSTRASTESAGGFMQYGSLTYPVTTAFSLNNSSVGADGATIHLDGLRSSSKIPAERGPNNIATTELTLNTDLDIKEGQKVVVGRMGISREQAMFLVVTARIAP